MRLRTYNSRRKRLHCGKKEPTGEPFCYIVYNHSKRVYPCGCGCGYMYVNGVLTHPLEISKAGKRLFPNYPEAIAHLTRIKLAIDEEDSEWADSTPCKIVEGVYTKSGKEIITKEVRLSNECDRLPERHFSSGLPRQYRIRAELLTRKYNVPLQQALGFVTGRTNSLGWSGGSATSSSSATAMDIGGVRYKILSY